MERPWGKDNRAWGLCLTSSGGAKDEGELGVLLRQKPYRLPPWMGYILVPDALPGSQVAFLEGVGTVDGVSRVVSPGS